MSIILSDFCRKRKEWNPTWITQWNLLTFRKDAGCVSTVCMNRASLDRELVDRVWKKFLIETFDCFIRETSENADQSDLCVFISLQEAWSVIQWLATSNYDWSFFNRLSWY